MSEEEDNNHTENYPEENNWPGAKLLENALLCKQDGNCLEYIYFLSIACGKQHLPALEEYCDLIIIHDWRDVQEMCEYESEHNPTPAYFLAYLAFIYTMGSNIVEAEVEQDLTRAIDLHRQAIKLDNLYVKYNSKFLVTLGMELLEQGHAPEGEEWLRLTYGNYPPREAGHFTYIMATMHFRGDSVSRNYNIAFSLYKLSAELGHALSYAALSDLYREGDGVEQNLSKAEEMYLKFIELAN